MMINSDNRSHRYGYWLVLLQFSLVFGLILITSPLNAITSGNLGTLILMAISVIVALAALKANQFGNFNIHPSPKQNGRLIVHGIYQYIRHPMYTAVMLFGLACMLASPSLESFLILFALCLVLVRKSRLEETWLKQKYPSYSDYLSKTRGFLPWFY
jgi:protein-S-isoprenylcysteine O-methyltransferase Ste14